MATVRKFSWPELGPAMGAWLKTQFERADLMQSCISCRRFDEKAETCKLAPPPNNRPPARIIANGCPQYDDAADIPF